MGLRISRTQGEEFERSVDVSIGQCSRRRPSISSLDSEHMSYSIYYTMRIQ
jgi:hypothetical protein